MLQQAAMRGYEPQYFITLTMKDVLPLWREAPEPARSAGKAESAALAKRLTTALNRLVAEIRRTYGPCEEGTARGRTHTG